MAPIKKTRKRASAEIEELSGWFSSALNDQSNFMRYENVQYPDFTLEELDSDPYEAYTVDDEFYIRHKLHNVKQMRALTQTHSDVNPSEFNTNPRLVRLRRSLPYFITFTTILLFIPTLINILTTIISSMTRWFFDKSLDDQIDDSTEDNHQQFSSLPVTLVQPQSDSMLFESPTDYELPQNIEKSNPPVIIQSFTDNLNVSDNLIANQSEPDYYAGLYYNDDD